MSLVALPKIVLHEHLDGGLRPSTVVDLAAECGYRGLPTTRSAELAEWFDQRAAGGLERYLQAFEHTLAVMQTASAVERVACEAGQDLARDGVVYAEVRFAPMLSTSTGTPAEAVMEAALSGLRHAEAETGMTLSLIVDAMRDAADSAQVAELAVRYREEGVVGFDIAGPEAGYPAQEHAHAFRIAAEGGLGITVHAGEGDGPSSVAAALDVGAQRIGHGVRIIEDCRIEEGEIVDLGPIATRVHDAQVPLEVCPHSNLHTLGWTPAEHPVGLLHRAGFVVTISPDNRLMSGVQTSDELRLLVRHHGFGVGDLQQVMRHAIQAAFCDDDTKRSLTQTTDAAYRAASTKSIMS